MKLDWLAKNPQVINAIDYARCANKIVVDIEMACAAKTKPFNGVRQMLSELTKRGIKRGVVTRNCREAVLQTFQATAHAAQTRGDIGASSLLAPTQKCMTAWQSRGSEAELWT